MSESKCATVVSSSSTLWGRKYRSSPNFVISPHAKQLRFKVIDHPNPSSINFKVVKDVRFWEQPLKIWNDFVVYEKVSDGSKLPVHTEGLHYIANPCGTNGRIFTVEIYENYQRI